MASNAWAIEPARALPGTVRAIGAWHGGPLSPRRTVRGREPGLALAHLSPQPAPRGRSGKSWQRRCSGVWGWWFAVGCLTLVSLTSCRATMGRVIGQQFVSPTYAFAAPLPGDEWQPVPDEPS